MLVRPLARPCVAIQRDIYACEVDGPGPASASSQRLIAAVGEWLAAHPDAPGAAGLRACHGKWRDNGLTWSCALPGWVIFIGRRAG